MGMKLEKTFVNMSQLVLRHFAAIKSFAHEHTLARVCRQIEIFPNFQLNFLSVT
jgi:hypothetical protein